MLIVLTTVSDEPQAEKLATAIVELRLAACVQILPRMTSVYVWQGNIEREGEHLLLIKTLAEKYDELEAFIKANHAYETPEIVAIDAERVEQNYAGWLKDHLR
jgi:periplasmic divalent cation tolerance protein